MFVLEINKNQVRVSDKESMTSGSQNVYVVEFKLSSEWDYLEKVAVFATDVGPDGPIEKTVYRQLLDENNRCVIPWEVNVDHDKTVFIGLLGMANGNIILPTIWANVGSVLLGVTDGVTSPEPPTPDIYQQILIKLNEIKGISALDVFTDKVATNIHDFDEASIPGSIVMINSSINAQNMNLAFAKDVVYVESVTNQNGSSLRIVSVSNNGYDFSYNENGDFISMTPIPLPVGEKGDPGTTFTPSLSESGILSWTNNGELPNPEPVSIKGPKGGDGASAYQIAINNGFVGTESEWLESLKGDKGDPGQTGLTGKNATINGQNTLEIIAGENITIEQNGSILTINTMAILQGIEIVTPPDKTDYHSGDYFDPTGMVVNAIYSIGFSNQIIDYDIIPNGPLEDGMTKVTLSYTDNGVTVTVDQLISVTSGIYGVIWDGTSTTKWTRTDASALFVDPNPAVNNGSGSSPFDNIMPWSGMVIVEDISAGVLVKIPKFWYKFTKSGNTLKLQIANWHKEGFYVSPAHADRGDGKGERDFVYAGRYHCHESNYKSQTGGKPKVSITRSAARTSIHNLGATIWQFDLAMRQTIQMLYLVEFADWNSQTTIGGGCSETISSSRAVFNMGKTDAMTYHTGTVSNAHNAYGVCQYRWIEGLWDNCYDWMDGCYYNSNGLNIILNPSNFSDTANGTLVGKPSNGYPSVMDTAVQGGVQWMYPTAANGSQTTYIPEVWNFSASGPCLFCGSDYYQYLYRGLFCVDCEGASYSKGGIGCRLQKLP